MLRHVSELRQRCLEGFSLGEHIAESEGDFLQALLCLAKVKCNFRRTAAEHLHTSLHGQIPDC